MTGKFTRSVAKALAFGIFALATGCSEHFLLRTGIKTADPYVEGETAEGTSFDKLSEHVYTAKVGWYRNVVIDTAEGVVVIDPMGPKMVGVVQRGIAEKLKGKRVHTVIYSHYHLDHVGGGLALAPEEVIGHEKCPAYWKDLGARDVAPITRPIHADEKLVIGGVEIQALYLGHSHSDTLYAFYLPGDRTLFTADLGMVRTVPPVGVPDSYWPGYVAALDRVAALDFDTFVPSHFDHGKKKDLVDYIEFVKLSRSLAKESLARHGALAEGARFEDFFDDIYPVMKDKYGDWHGFGAMFISNMVRDVTGEALGY
jgi:glyoxylase-like metal-dependent hydrolase (beta-lactamase superfamily II)